MTYTNFPRFVFLLSIIMVGNTLHSQSTKEAVILYNSQAVLAQITKDGEVKEIIQDEPDYLKGFTIKIQDYGQFVANQQTMKSDQKVVLPSVKTFSEIDDNYISVPFESGYATLSDLAISRLDEVIGELRKSPSARVIIRTLSTKKDALIDKNRINSVRTYFKIRGIAQERLSYETLSGDRDIDEVKINYIF